MTDVAPDRAESAVVAQVSRGIVGIHARYYGRGPTKARTIWRNGVVVCVLEDVFTRGERLLVERGKFQQVRAQRIAFQDEVEPLLRQIVEASTREDVRSFLSQVSADGVASEVFVLDLPRS